MKPKLVMGNIFRDVTELRAFALEHGFSGVDWSFDMDSVPILPAQESSWVRDVNSLSPLEVRYHCPFYRIDLGHDNREESQRADALFRGIVRLVAKARGRYLTIHIGLGRDTTEPLSWDVTIENLSRLVQYGAGLGVTICLENLAWGWTSRPNLFEKLVRKSGAGVTIDIGHAAASEALRTQEYQMEDFVAPHADRVFNAHLYHKEKPGMGHAAPERIEDIIDRLQVIEKTGCTWWVIEIKEPGGLIRTKGMLEAYVENGENPEMRGAWVRSHDVSEGP